MDRSSIDENCNFTSLNGVKICELPLYLKLFYSFSNGLCSLNLHVSAYSCGRVR